MLRAVNLYDVDAVSEENALVCDDPSLTHQSFKEECDINTIIDRFGLSGEVPIDVPVYTNNDFCDVVTDFQSAMNQVLAAEKSFMAMPAHVRARFSNNAAEFVDFCSNPANGEEMVQLGLAVRRLDAEDGGKPGGEGTGST